MGIIAVLIGGLTGFSGFLVALLGYDLGWIASLGVYMTIGFLTALTLVAMSLRPARCDMEMTAKIITAPSGS